MSEVGGDGEGVGSDSEALLSYTLKYIILEDVDLKYLLVGLR